MVYCPTYRWGQTQSHVVVTIDVLDSDVRSHNVSPEGHVCVKGKTSKGDFSLNLDLFGRVVAEDVEVNILPRTMRLKLPKAEEYVTWKTLQKAHIPRPVQEKKDFDFFVNSDGSDSDDSDASDEGPSLDAAAKAHMDGLGKKMSAADKAKEAGPPGGRERLFGPFPVPDELDMLLMMLAGLHLYMCPFTKVEESFNMQAIHDLLYHGPDLHKYDHNEFPGVVPRTFLGAMATALPTAPIALVFQAMGAPKIVVSNAARAVLGGMSVMCLAAFRWALGKRFGQAVASSFALICCCQFHIMFYCSRTLPNTFALGLVNLAFSYWVQDKYTQTFAIFAFTAAVFRFEIAVLAGIILLFALAKQHLRPNTIKIILIAALSGISGAVLSIGVDSVMWRRLLWPEAEVFYFNAILNKSHEWGTAPIWWYLLSAIPRSMLGTLLFIPGGLMWSPRMRPFFYPIAVYLVIFSLLPHKELRFILYVIPMLNAIASVELSRLWMNKDKGKYGKYYFRVGTTVMTFSAFGMWGFLRVSATNYPGGNALDEIHTMERANVTRGILSPYVHIDVSAAQQGITRFSEMPQPWRYSKKEGEHDMSIYTHLITSQPKVEGFTSVVQIQGMDLGAIMRGSTKPSMITKMRVLKRSDLDVLPAVPSKDKPIAGSGEKGDPLLDDEDEDED